MLGNGMIPKPEVPPNPRQMAFLWILCTGALLAGIIPVLAVDHHPVNSLTDMVSLAVGK